MVVEDFDGISVDDVAIGEQKMNHRKSEKMYCNVENRDRVQIEKVGKGCGNGRFTILS